MERACERGVGAKSLSCARLFATPWTIALQASLSMDFSRQEYWSGLPFLSPGYLANPGIELSSLTLQTDSLLSEPPGLSFPYSFIVAYSVLTLNCM